MFMRQLRVAFVVMGFAVASGPALGADADVLREAADRAQIQELMWRYVRALDSLDADAYASVFTEDGKFSSGQSAETGRPALKKMVADLKANRDQRSSAGEPNAPMYHVITNSHIEFTGKDTARYHSYWMTVFGAAGQGTTPRVAAAGRGVDELVRVNGEWLIKDRNVAPRD